MELNELKEMAKADIKRFLERGMSLAEAVSSMKAVSSPIMDRAVNQAIAELTKEGVING